MKVLLSSCVFLLKPAPESSPSIMPTLILLLFLVFFIGGIWLLVIKFYYKHLFESWNKKTRLDMIAKDEAKNSAAPAQQGEQISSVSPSGVADELAKLAQLKDAGILMEEEFNAQKAKLLNS